MKNINTALQISFIVCQRILGLCDQARDTGHVEHHRLSERVITLVLFISSH